MFDFGEGIHRIVCVYNLEGLPNLPEAIYRGEVHKNKLFLEKPSIEQGVSFISD